MTSLLLNALLLCTGVRLGQTAELQSRVIQAVAKDLGINQQEAKANFGMQILGSEVPLPEQALLRVAAVHAAWGGGAWLLRMECGSRVECLPFEVILRARQQDLGGLLEARTRPLSAGYGTRFGPALVRAGQRVRLAEEASGMRLSVPAVCLQAGSMGQRIRVRNVSSGRVVLARVRAAGQVAVED